LPTFDSSCLLEWSSGLEFLLKAQI
jgi:hypothetical protein